MPLVVGFTAGMGILVVYLWRKTGMGLTNRARARFILTSVLFWCGVLCCLESCPFTIPAGFAIDPPGDRFQPRDTDRAVRR